MYLGLLHSSHLRTALTISPEIRIPLSFSAGDLACVPLKLFSHKSQKMADSGLGHLS